MQNMTVSEDLRGQKHKNIPLKSQSFEFDGEIISRSRVENTNSN